MYPEAHEQLCYVQCTLVDLDVVFGSTANYANW